MKKLLLLLVSITLFSCTETNTESMAVAPNNLGSVTFTYNGETISYIGDNDINKPETFNLYGTNLQFTVSSTTGKSIILDSGLSKGAHSIVLSCSPNLSSIFYVKNGVLKIASSSSANDNLSNLQITITEETSTYISGTFQSNDINGTFTKIPKKIQ